MAKRQLTRNELDMLLLRYKSQQAVLNHQLTSVDKEISSLETKLERVIAREEKQAEKAKKASAKKTTTSGRRGRPRKNAAPATTTETATATKKTPARRGRPKTTKSSTTATKKTTAKKATTKKASTKKASTSTSATGYRLNETDQMVMDALNEKNHALIAAELIDHVMTTEKAAGKRPKEAEVKSRINRTLHKLANRRKDLKKVKYSGRGYAYALPDWVSAGGALKKDYKRKS